MKYPVVDECNDCSKPLGMCKCNVIDPLEYVDDSRGGYSEQPLTGETVFHKGRQSRTRL